MEAIMRKDLVSVREEFVLFPTYDTSPPEKSPLFLERRTYQGSTGKVYPLPVTEKIFDEKIEKEYRALILENEYLYVMILPELGGRIHRAFDKTNNYDFVYFNHVIKPALVGLTGPWISGGIEFNWPQHHRPSTFCPVDSYYTTNKDGSASVFVSETDKMYGTKGMAEIKLYPGKAYIEINGQVYNPTDTPQTFLWWANPAVPVNDDTFSVFPPDVHAVMDHGKRAVSTFPIATGEYYKADYSAGVDISKYKNIPVPTSYMAAHSDYDFIGNYDAGKEAGLLHVADHHISPGKKQWTWGNGDFGRTWDANLTDDDGPYIELMTGVFTDNQPDFTWLKPHETKNFTQYFMPYKGVGRVGNASKDLAISVIPNQDKSILINVYGTSIMQNCSCKIFANDTLIDNVTLDLNPNYHQTLEVAYEAAIKDLQILVTNQSGEKLLEYKSYIKELQAIPEAAEALVKPEEMKSLEELFFAAQHLEQYRHSSFHPEDYYREGLRRDPTDSRLNNGYGVWLLRKGLFEKAKEHFEKSIAKQTWKNPNPYSGESYYNLGLSQLYLDEEDAAYDSFYKATWSAECQTGAFYHLACLAWRKGEKEKALEFAQTSKLRNWHNVKARQLELAIQRFLGRDSQKLLEESLEIDPLSMGLLYEQSLQNKKYSNWKEKMRAESHNYLLLSFDFMSQGMWADAEEVLLACETCNPLVYYYLSYIAAKQKDSKKETAYLQKAENCSTDYCFPNKLHEILILEHAIQNPNIPTPMAHYYLGNLFYDKKRYDEAEKHWTTSLQLHANFSMNYRNLAMYYHNVSKNKEKALEMMEKARKLEPQNPRFLLEFDQISAIQSIEIQERFALLDAAKDVVEQRDDLYLRYIHLLNMQFRYDEAFDHILKRKFHPWEGGEGKVSFEYKVASSQLAIRAIENKQYKKAIQLLESCLVYPKNLGEGKLPNVPDNKYHYYLARAYEGLEDKEKSNLYDELASQGEENPQVANYYNDQSSEYLYYKGLAFLSLGKEKEAIRCFHKLISFGEKHVFDQVEFDFFAVSQPEMDVYHVDMQKKNRQYCNFLRALGHLGKGEIEQSRILLEEILSTENDHLEANIFLKQLEK